MVRYSTSKAVRGLRGVRSFKRTFRSSGARRNVVTILPLQSFRWSSSTTTGDFYLSACRALRLFLSQQESSHHQHKSTMTSLLKGLLHATNFRNPFLRTLIPSIGLAYGLQFAFAVPSIALQTERVYDLSGSLTYISCVALSLYLPTLRARFASLPGTLAPAWPSLLQSLVSKGGANTWNWRQVVLSAAVTFWAARLGSFLFARITAEDGKDSRFDSIRGTPSKFIVAFFAQATWVSLCLMPVLAINSIPAATLAALPLVTITDIVGLLLYVGGITFEATADKQKSQWMKEKKEKKHSEDFLTRGLWSKSRHPVSGQWAHNDSPG